MSSSSSSYRFSEMSSFEFDSVKAEKADAITTYNRNTNYISYSHRLITAVALLCSFPYFPVLKEISTAYFSLFNRQIYVFFLINAIIFIIYHFSNNDAAAASQPDLYDHYVSLSSTSTLKETKAAAIEIEDKLCDKQIVVCENAQSAPEEENSNPDLTETKADSKIRLRRTQSEKYTTVKKKSRTLLRSETENGRELVLAGAIKSMEDMNNDEFRCTIERFIASKKKVLRDENFAVMEEKEE
ncbi:uncharacterized protein [Euphorbia lathyris]|uniref:uncharacterized protein n=1 Tax=Euphorbia lathyris TaxID=212925 RepID=UPI003313AB87